MLLPPHPVENKPISFVVREGEGVYEIVARLKGEGLIKSSFGFTLYSLVTGAAARFKPGAYSFQPFTAGYRISAALTRGSKAVPVMIPEGATLVDADRILAAAGIIKPKQLIEYNRVRQSSLEGFLFPDTYKFFAGSSAETVAGIMKNNFDARIGAFIAYRPRDEWYTDLIIASLLEKEAIRPRDRVLVAGVIRERLRLEMPIQIDAANVYGKCAGAYLTCPDNERALSKADFAADDPYNTYRRSGLPPTPIANPGVDAFIAAMHSEKSPYLYYISDPKTGHLIFASTLDQHNNNRKKYHVN